MRQAGVAAEQQGALKRLAAAHGHRIRQRGVLARAAGYQRGSDQLDLVLGGDGGRRLQERHEPAERRGGRLTVHRHGDSRIPGDARQPRQHDRHGPGRDRRPRLILRDDLLINRPVALWAAPPDLPTASGSAWCQAAAFRRESS